MSHSQLSFFILLIFFWNFSLQMNNFNTFNSPHTKNIQNIKKENNILFFNICDNKIFCKNQSLSNCEFFNKDKIKYTCFCHDKFNTKKFIYKLNQINCLVSQCQIDCLEKIDDIKRLKKKQIHYQKNYFTRNNFPNQFFFKNNNPYFSRHFQDLKKKNILNLQSRKLIKKNIYKIPKMKSINFELSKNKKDLFSKEKLPLTEDDIQIRENRFYYKNAESLED